MSLICPGQAEHKDKKEGRELDLNKFVRDPTAVTPQQLNGSDCGVFLCKVCSFSASLPT